MSTREALASAIEEHVTVAAASGETIDVTPVAIRLSSAHPQSGMTLDDISNALRKAAERAGAKIKRRRVGPEDEDRRVLPGEGGANDD